MIGPVHRRTDQFGHAPVDDGELLARALLDVQHAGDQRPAGGHDAAAQLEVHGRAGRELQVPAESAEIRLEIRDRQVVGMLVIDPQAAAHVDVADRAAATLQAQHQLVDAVAQRPEIHHIQDLGANVEMKPAILHVWQAQGQVHHLVELLVIDAKLVLRQAGRDPGVRVGPDVGVDAQAHRRHLPHPGGQFVEDLQLGRGLGVETRDPGAQRQADLLVALAHAGIDDALRRETGLQGSADLPTAHTVGAESARGDLREDARVEVRLDGIVHPEGRIAVQLRLHGVQRTTQKRQVVVVERRPQAPEALYREITLQHYSNRHLLKERRARALSSPFTRKEML